VYIIIFVIAFVENQSSDFLLGVVVFRTQRLVEQSGSNADVDPSAAFPASQKSYNSSVELNPERNFGKPDWTTALASTTSTQIVAAPKAKNTIPVSSIELKANGHVIQGSNVIHLSNLSPALHQEEDLRSVNPVQANDQNQRESSKPNFIIPKLRPNFLDRSPTVATSSVKLSADPTTSGKSRLKF
jgi:hypothetical protein